jgi:uncharacterized OB-fold protein
MNSKPDVPRSQTAAAIRRPRPGITHDNRFFWPGVKEGRLLIQRCESCKQLRHPPAPMCSGCRCLEWDTVQSSGRGTVYSYVQHYYPNIPPFEPGHAVAVVELEEGTRLVSDRAGIDGDDVTIGLCVQVEFNAVDEELTLAPFRPC